MLRFLAIAAVAAATYLPTNPADAQGVANTSTETCTSRTEGCNNYCKTTAQNPMGCYPICQSRHKECLATGIYKSSAGDVKVEPK